MEDKEITAPIHLPVPSEPFSVTEAAELGRQIGASLQKTAEQILKTSDLCLIAKQRYGEFGLPAVLAAAKMKKSKFMKYLSIAHDARLRDIQPLLPASFSTIHLMVQLSDKVFKEAVKAELIRPDARRGEIEALRKPLASKGKGAAQATDLPAAVKEIAPGGRVEFVVPDDLDADACAEVRRVLHKLKMAFGVQILSIRELDRTTSATMSTIATGSDGSPVNPPPRATQELAPSELPKPSAPPSAKTAAPPLGSQRN
jgi:hypothetical protein